MRFAGLLLALFWLVAAPLGAAAPLVAREQIDDFDVVIEVSQDGDIVVTETLVVTVAGIEIQRGIFRDLPRYYENGSARLPFQYDIISVRRDGREEPFETSEEGNAFRVRVGDPGFFLEHGPHTFEIKYEVKNQVRYFERYDEIYWNVTGNYWAFPINHARATIVLPPGARITAAQGYTGAFGEKGEDYRYAADGGRHVFESTRPLDVREGLTVALGFEKGLIDPPSSADRGMLWWQRNGALAILLASLGGLGWFLWRGFNKVGRDPVKGPVFPRYEAPRGYSPAAVHHIYYRSVTGHRALIATLMHLASKGRMRIDASDKKATVLSRTPQSAPAAGLADEDVALEQAIFGGASTKVLGGAYDAGFTAAHASFVARLGAKYGAPFFRWNVGYTLGALALSLLAFGIALTQAPDWTFLHTVAVVALAALNLGFMYLMPAPTVLGQQVRTEIEGFKLYMETAEKLQLNASKIDGPPMMSVERYERFLPYAVALGVEKPWTSYFEKTMPAEAAAYRPAWSSTSFNSAAALNSAMIASMSSGVTTALPQSSSSSGSGGGGSSGGGGGGGGGGGW
ncbi:MAG: DUF2207 domain-containing protein [Hyphomonadaceae bacterium]|nr:DUF2207 domain-containing protein [Hyphomonadaceae bacterium]